MPICVFSTSLNLSVDRRGCGRVACRVSPSGHIELLSAWSWRAKVYAGKDTLSGRQLWFRKSRKAEVEVQIEHGKQLALAADRTAAWLGRHRRRAARHVRPRSPGWDIYALETNLCYIRHTIKPVQVAALCGQVRLTFARLDNARLTGDLNLADRFEELANAVTEALGTLPGGPAALLDRARSHARARAAQRASPVDRRCPAPRIQRNLLSSPAEQAP